MNRKERNPEPPALKLHWYQYSLRTLLLFVLICSILCSCVAVRMQHAKRQREAAAAIVKLGGYVRYDWQVNASGNGVPSARPPGPTWLRSLLGDDIFANVYFVCGTKDRSLITDEAMAYLQELTNLRELDLYGTAITDAGLKNLKALTHLEVLKLSDTQITDAGLENLKGLTQLKDLDLTDTGITDAGLENLKGLAGLQRLCLYQTTNITDAGLKHLQGLIQLKNLDLISTDVTQEGVNKLQQALPGCQIDSSCRTDMILRSVPPGGGLF